MCLEYGVWGASGEQPGREAAGRWMRPLEPCRLLSKKNWATAKEMKPGSSRLAGPFGPILPSVQKGLAAGSPVWEPGGPRRPGGLSQAAPIFHAPFS